MAETLKFKELSVHIDVSFWFELERKKLNDWRLEEPQVPLTVWTNSICSHKHQLPGFVTISADSFSVGRRLANQSNLPTTLVNYNTVEQLVNLDKKAALKAAGANIEQIIQSGDWSSGSLTQIALFTYSDLKHHKFSYIVAVPTLDFGKPFHAKKPVAAASALEAPVLSAAVDYAQSKAEESVGAMPFVVDGKSGKCETFSPASVASETAVIAFTDSSNLAEHPGWVLRNILAAVRYAHPKKTHMTVLCLRGGGAESSLVIEVECEPLDADEKPAIARTLGWLETKIRHIEMGAQMDPTRLADSSANLNLGLMKWRMMPNIDLDGLKSCKALLLGSGTLGCNIGRNLVGWGVRHLTFVDRGSVSYSNPVRQSLFELNDCLADGPERVKSLAAARGIKRILPTVNAEGIEMTIRMPGHRVDDTQREAAVRDIQQLEELIKSHDVIFLLTDSRESRWLPTLLATAHNKPVINSALGFDTYVVMRHGLPSQKEDQRVGCYFCNDVVAPIDSLTARTLDQQCTVTRPGVSGVASALAVELLASLYNHPQGFNAPAYKVSDDNAEVEGVLGLLPHQVRGSVSDYSAMTLHGPSYSMCTACSDIMVSKYKEGGCDFIIECLNRPDLMEEITGLKAQKEKMKEQYADWDDEDFDD